MTRLSDSHLQQLATGDIALPRYDRGQVTIGIVHLGIGAFHRAHQALYTEAVLNLGELNWGISAVSLRRPAVRDQLLPQDGLYTSVVKKDEQQQLQVVGAVKEVLVAPEDPHAVIARLAGPAISVVTLTITEKGYQDRAEGSAADYLCQALALRMASGLSGLTLISCDNVSGNGRKLAELVLGLARNISAELATWINDNCRFPETMVDRIVPATTAADLAMVQEKLGLRDEGAVVSEAFSQWVIKDNFAGPVPPWDRVGAQFVSDVAPYEAMKLRLLNASHSAIAYLGCLAGWETVAEAMAQPPLRDFVARLMEDVTPALSIPDGFDVDDYKVQLLQRFSNTALQHQSRQIAIDGSQKLPQRIVPTLLWQLENDVSIESLTLVLAAWVLLGRIEPLDDPLADQISTLHTSFSDNPADYLDAVLGLEQVFPPELAASQRFRQQLLSELRKLGVQGVRVRLSELGG